MLDEEDAVFGFLLGSDGPVPEAVVLSVAVPCLSQEWSKGLVSLGIDGELVFPCRNCLPSMHFQFISSVGTQQSYRPICPGG